MSEFFFRQGPAMLIGAMMLVMTAAGAEAQAPQMGELAWDPQDAYCRFARTDDSAPDPANVGPYLFVTELVSDDRVSLERGYMRIDGLLRELELIERIETEALELRAYRTFGDSPVKVNLAMTRGESRKSSQGQIVFVRFTGTVTATRDTAQRQVAVTGVCGMEPGS